MRRWRLTMTAWVLLLGLAIAPAAQAEEGEEREFGGLGSSEGEACDEARQEMEDENHAARGDGSCDRCYAMRYGAYPHEPTGVWECMIWGVEQASDDLFLVLPSSDDETDVDEDEDAEDDEEEDSDEDWDEDEDEDWDEDEEDAGGYEEDEDP